MSGKTPDGVTPPSELWHVDRLAAYLGAPKSFVYRLTRQRRIHRQPSSLTWGVS